jgi:hypothetical protein
MRLDDLQDDGESLTLAPSGVIEVETANIPQSLLEVLSQFQIAAGRCNVPPRTALAFLSPTDSFQLSSS